MSRVDVLKTGTRPPVISDYGISWRNWVQKDKNNTPNWKYVVSHHLWKPENVYQLWKERVVMPQGYPFCKQTWIPTGEYSVYSGRDPAGYSISATYLEPSAARKVSILNSLNGRLLEKIKDQKVNLGVFFAERHQMLSMFGNTINRLRHAYNAVRRGRFGEAFNALGSGSTRRVNRFRSSASNWLELQYGWLPLLSDVYGMSEEFERTWARYKLQRPNPIFTERVSLEYDDEDSFTTSNRLQVINREMIYRARAWCSYTVDVESINFLGRVGLTNPLAIAWEVVPFSFVVDWFLPVGRFLNTLDATLGCTFVSGGNSGLCHSILTSSREGSYIDGNNLFEWTLGPTKGYLDRYERAPSGGFPAVSLPQLKDPVSQLHVANALALLTQAFTRK